MSVLFADTYYYLALMSKHDRAHARAVDLSRRSPRIVTSSWIVLEVANGMKKPGRRSAFVAFLKALQADSLTEIVQPSTALFESGVELFSQRLDKEWSLTDCISFVIMKERGLTEALTGDRHFEQAGYTLLMGHAES